MSKPLSAIALAAALAAAAPAAAQTVDTLTVVITDVQSAKGRVQAELCPKALFTKDCPNAVSAPAQPGTVRLTFRNVPAGEYAVQGFHDLNANGRIDRNFLGIPKEPFAFSNDAPVRFGPPKWTDAMIRVGAGQPAEVTMKLRKGP